MAYLSRIWLNPLRPATQRLMANPQITHAAVLGGIAAHPVTERLLWRLDVRDGRRAELLVLSRSTPSWEHVIEQFGWSSADEPQAVTRDYQQLLERIEIGREFRFRLRANPVEATRNPSNPSTAQKEHLSQSRPRGVRVAHRTAGQQTTWLLDRLNSWGFGAVEIDGLPAVLVIGRERVSFSKREGGAGRRVTVNTALFDGTLRVTDAAAARASLLNGVGPARAYGCGLITLAPLRDSGERN